MVSRDSVRKQLKRLGFNPHGWGRGEVQELHNVLLPDEEVYELVNGIYEGGFALLLATDVRVLLVDKKPLNYLTVEDLRFDMINEMDYNRRLIGAKISIATGNKDLRFHSYNPARLRKLINHVQHSMAEIKKKSNSHQEDQKQHLEQINQQLQAYLVAQHQHQIQIQQIQQAQRAGIQAPPPPEPIKPSPELSDFLFAQSLLAQYQAQTGISDPSLAIQPELMQQIAPQQQPMASPLPPTAVSDASASQMNDLYAEGMQEIFGNRPQQTAAASVAPTPSVSRPAPAHHSYLNPQHLLEINPMRIAYSKLPMALRNRKFGRPSLHAHSQQEEKLTPAAPFPLTEL